MNTFPYIFTYHLSSFGFGFYFFSIDEPSEVITLEEIGQLMGGN
jgi:hypothetical protein